MIKYLFIWWSHICSVLNGRVALNMHSASFALNKVLGLWKDKVTVYLFLLTEGIFFLFWTRSDETGIEVFISQNPEAVFNYPAQTSGIEINFIKQTVNIRRSNDVKHFLAHNVTFENLKPSFSQLTQLALSEISTLASFLCEWGQTAGKYLRLPLV